MKLPRYHEDRTVRSVNSLNEPGFSVFGSLSDAITGDASLLRNIPLTNARMKLYPSLEEIPEEAVLRDFPAPGYRLTVDLSLPWQAMGAESTVWLSGRLPIPCFPPLVPDRTPCCVFLADAELNEPSTDDLVLRIPGVSSACWLFVNGQPAGFTKGAVTRSFSVGKYFTAGINRIAAIVAKYSDDSYTFSPDGFEKSGFLGMPSLCRRSGKRLSDLRIITEFSDNGKSVSVSLSSLSCSSFSVSIISPAGEPCAEAKSKKGSAVCEVRLPSLWNAEDPRIYTAVIEAAGEFLRVPFGIREASLCEGGIRLNKRELRLCAVRLRSFSKKSLVSSQEDFRNDLRMMKYANINTVVTCDIMPDSFFGLTDRGGMYVVVTLPVGTDSFLSCRGAAGLDDDWREAIARDCLLFARELLLHPSVIAFSAVGATDAELFRKIKTLFEIEGLPLLERESFSCVPLWCDELLGEEKPVGQREGLVCTDRVPKPLLLTNIKARYSPIAFSRGDTASEYVIENLRSFTYLSDVEITYEITRCGEESASGSLGIPTIAPGARRLLTLPAVPADGICRVVLSAVAVGDFGRKRGEIVSRTCFAVSSELALPTRLRTVPDDTSLTEDDDRITVSGIGFSVSFDRMLGGISSWVVSGREFMRGCSGCSIYLPVGNGSAARRNYLFGNQLIKVSSVSADRLSDGSSRVGFSLAMTEKGRVPCAVCEPQFTVFPDGRISCRVAVRLTDDAPVPDCIGLTLPLDSEFFTAEWYGMGPDECYPDLTGFCYTGEFRSTARKMLSSGAGTALSGMRCGASFAGVSDREHSGLLVTGDELCFSLLPLSPYDRSKSSDAAETDTNYLTVASRVRNALSDEGAFYENEAETCFVLEPFTKDSGSLWDIYLARLADDAADSAERKRNE